MEEAWKDYFEELEDVGVWRNLEKHHDAVDQLVALEFLRGRRKTAIHG